MYPQYNIVVLLGQIVHMGNRPEDENPLSFSQQGTAVLSFHMKAREHWRREDTPDIDVPVVYFGRDGTPQRRYAEVIADRLHPESYVFVVGRWANNRRQDGSIGAGRVIAETVVPLEEDAAPPAVNPDADLPF